MAGNRYIADLTVTYVLKETWSRNGAWRHIEGEIYKGILWAALSHILFALYECTSFLVKKNQHNPDY